MIICLILFLFLCCKLVLFIWRIRLLCWMLIFWVGFFCFIFVMNMGFLLWIENLKWFFWWCRLNVFIWEIIVSVGGIVCDCFVNKIIFFLFKFWMFFLLILSIWLLGWSFVCCVMEFLFIDKIIIGIFLLMVKLKVLG